MRLRTLVAILSVTAALTGPALGAGPAFAAGPAGGPVGACPDGHPACVDVTIAQMRARFAPLGLACDHNAVFALTYLRTTQTYKWARDQPGFFADPTWVNREDAIFAEFYFAAYDAWAAGRRPEVPGAWLVALDAARDRAVTAPGNVLLGLNAHVNRDLPYVLAAIGLTRPDGTSRKPDHDRVNQFLALVMAPLLVELSTRLDPYGTVGGLPADAVFDLIVAWRERAWRNAERLVAATGPLARALVVADIEASATAQAAFYRALTSYVPPLTTPGPRDTHCAVHNGDAPPAYVFGTPPPF